MYKPLVPLFWINSRPNINRFRLYVCIKIIPGDKQLIAYEHRIPRKKEKKKEIPPPPHKKKKQTRLSIQPLTRKAKLQQTTFY